MTLHHRKVSFTKAVIGMFILCVTLAHYAIPMYEHWVSMMVNLAWLFAPSEA